MKVKDSAIAEVKIIEPQVFGDDRGFFMESFNQKSWEKLTGVTNTFVQDNHSRSGRWVLRGLHYQLPPFAQAKLVRCIVGEIFDVAVDIRKYSATFGKWVGINLSAENKLQLWIPEGFAHGFMVLSDAAEILYKTNNYYAPDYERSILWNDPDIDIKWPSDIEPHLSRKDTDAIKFKKADLF